MLFSSATLQQYFWMKCVCECVCVAVRGTDGEKTEAVADGHRLT